MLFELGVNFLDESETNLRHQATAEQGELTDLAGLRAESGPASDPLFWLLLTIGGTAILVNWCLLSPKRQQKRERGEAAPRARSWGMGRSPI